MRWPIILTICRKELLETLRDRRTIILMLFLPVVLYPVLLIGFSQIISHQVAKLQTSVGTVLLVGDAPPDLVEMINDEPILQVRKSFDLPPRPEQFEIVKEEPKASRGLLPAQTFAEEELSCPPELKTWAHRQIQAGKGDLVLVLSASFRDSIERGRTGTALVFYDETNESTLFLNNRLFETLREYRRQLLAARLQAQPDLPAGFERPIFAQSANVASARKRGGYFVGRILPMMMIIMVMLGAFYPAVDLAAGEKERGTMQTLLTAPALPLEIILGKFVTVFIISLVSALANLGSLALALVYLLESGSVAGNLNFKLEFGTGIIMLLQLIPVALLFSALMLAVSVFAKSFKEAQNYLTPLYLIVIVPVLLSGLPGTALSARTAWVPILNITLLIKDLLVEPPTGEIIVMVLIANSVYSMLALVLAVRVFKSEQVLLGGQGAFLDAFRTAGAGRSKATPGLAFGVLGLGLVLYFYIGGMLQKWNLVYGLMLSQYLVLFGLVVVIVWRLRLSVRQALSLKRPPFLSLLGAALAGGSSWLVATAVGGWIQNQLLPVPKGIGELLEQQLGQLMAADIPVWLMLLAVALTPAICEELFFRGLVFSGLRNGFGAAAAVVITALAFGVYHVSIYLILPTAIIGLVITYILWRSGSIVPAMLYHFLHNGLTLLVHRYKWFPDLIKGEQYDWKHPIFVLAVVVFLAGLALVEIQGRWRGVGQSKEDD